MLPSRVLHELIDFFVDSEVVWVVLRLRFVIAEVTLKDIDHVIIIIEVRHELFHPVRQSVCQLFWQGGCPAQNAEILSRVSPAPEKVPLLAVVEESIAIVVSLNDIVVAFLLRIRLVPEVHHKGSWACNHGFYSFAQNITVPAEDATSVVYPDGAIII